MAQSPTDKAKAPQSKPTSPSGNSFGIKPEGITSEAMRNALLKLQEAGVVEGRRGSLTFFRWTTTEPLKLAHLGLWGPGVGNSQAALIAALPDLENVSFYETNIDDEGLLAVTRLANLRNLSITPIIRYEKADYGPPQWSYPFMPLRNERPRITGKVLPALSALKTIESLDLLDVKLTPSDLAPLATLPKLGTLSLPNVIDGETIKHLQACKRFSNLTLGHRTIEAHEIAQLANLKNLRRLTLIHTKLPLDVLKALQKLESLEELHLRDCGLTDDTLAHLQCPARLKLLSLERNEIDGPGLVHLREWPIQVLGLEFNNLRDESLKHLPQLTRIEDLRLSYCRGITDAGIKAGTLQGMKHLKQLNLRGLQKVTDASLDELVKLNHLEHITIRETKISNEGVATMKQKMPRTNVFK